MKISLKHIGILFAVTGVVACGDKNESLGDKAKSAVDATQEKASDVKDAVTGKESRAEIEKNFDDQITDLQTKISELESRERNERDPDVVAAAKVRLDRVRASYTAAENSVLELKKSTEANWEAKKDKAAISIEKASDQITSAINRQEFRDDVDEKLEKIQLKIQSLQEDASTARGDAKQKINESIDKLEADYADLRTRYSEFQNSTAEKWDDFKEGFTKSFDELSDAFKGLFS